MASADFMMLIGGQEYSGWKTMRITRSLENAASDFDVTVSERWLLNDEAWQIFPGATCELLMMG
jgi:prophage tail gpP-like protein